MWIKNAYEYFKEIADKELSYSNLREINSVTPVSSVRRLNGNNRRFNGNQRRAGNNNHRRFSPRNVVRCGDCGGYGHSRDSCPSGGEHCFTCGDPNPPSCKIVLIETVTVLQQGKLMRKVEQDRYQSARLRHVLLVLPVVLSLVLTPLSSFWTEAHIRGDRFPTALRTMTVNLRCWMWSKSTLQVHALKSLSHVTTGLV